MPEQPPVIAVIGAGIAGLAAALELQATGATVVVLEGSDRVGGKVRVSEVGGVSVDEGADSMLRRVPWGVELAESAGLDLISPVASTASIWTRGKLRPLPTGTVMGIPTDLEALGASHVLGLGTIATLPMDLARPGPLVVGDVSVGHLVSTRLGREVVDRLVDPLLGGVYAGRADKLSVQATLPQLWPHLQTHTSLIAAARAARGTPTEGPVFAGVEGGLGHLPPALAKGLDIKLGSPVTALTRTTNGWQVDGRAVDGVVLAVPAAPAAKLLKGLVPTEGLAGMTYASVGIVTLVLDGPTPGTGSGYLVPSIEGKLTKAVTFTSRKWDRSGPAVVRASVGRAGDAADLQRDDADLVHLIQAELRQAVGEIPRLVDSRVTRWGGGLPQYAVGHLDLVDSLRRALPAGLAVAGAAYDGVGVPACAKSGCQAARQVLATLTMGSWPSHPSPQKS